MNIASQARSYEECTVLLSKVEEWMLWSDTATLSDQGTIVVPLHDVALSNFFFAAFLLLNVYACRGAQDFLRLQEEDVASPTTGPAGPGTKVVGTTPQSQPTVSPSPSCARACTSSKLEMDPSSLSSDCKYSRSWNPSLTGMLMETMMMVIITIMITGTSCASARDYLVFYGWTARKHTSVAWPRSIHRDSPSPPASYAWRDDVG